MQLIKLRLLFIILSILDILLSWWFLPNPDCELNPLVRTVWLNYGFSGVILFKSLFTLISILAAELIPTELTKVKLYKFINVILGCTFVLHIINIIGHII